MSSLSQEFYIDESNELIETYRQIPSEWAHLNISESYEFLKSTGFLHIESRQNGTSKLSQVTIHKIISSSHAPLDSRTN